MVLVVSCWVLRGQGGVRAEAEPVLGHVEGLYTSRAELQLIRDVQQVKEPVRFCISAVSII